VSGRSARPIRIPRHLSDAHGADDALAGRRAWVASLPDVVAAVAADWGLEVGEPYEPGGRSAWVAPVKRGDERLVLKVGWPHFEAEDEAEGLRLWDGDGAVRCVSSRRVEDSDVLLLERCEPGAQLSSRLDEEEQDVVIAGLLRRLWAHAGEGASFRPLESLCSYWADGLERDLEVLGARVDPGLGRAALDLLRELPRSARESVLLCTDLHAENALSAQREPWLVIDPKPFLGDPAFDPVQHMLNCRRRLTSAPAAMCERLASLLDLDPNRVRLWLFARCAQEGIDDATMRDAAHRLAP
jgi:streptomycin 6-kinase